MYTRFVPGLAAYSYLIGDQNHKCAVVIDPVRDVDHYLSVAKEAGLTITDIIETHVHADFVSGSEELKAALGGRARIHASAMGGAKWTPLYADHKVMDGDRVEVGALTLVAFHTPGHTPEHITWKLEGANCYFTGDFLFVGSVGRPDLLGSEEQKKLSHDLYKSLFTRLASTPDAVTIFPAHGAGSLCGKSLGTAPTSTIGHERSTNPALQKKPEELWTAELLKEMPQAPPYFARMKQINIRGPKVFGANRPGSLPVSPDSAYSMQADGVQILDIRDTASFAKGHIPGAIHIPLSPMLSVYAGAVLSPDQRLLLCAAKENDVSEAVIQLTRVGFDDITGFLDGGVDAWQAAGFELDQLNTISPQEAFARLKGAERPLVIDVRSDTEWYTAHIKHAYHYTLGQLTPDLDHDITKDQELLFICGGGTRSAIMASQFKRAGWKRTTNIAGGMGAWRQAGLPIASEGFDEKVQQ